ncbi:MAG: MFS transporter, partial [Nitrospinota bacterium]
MGRSSGGLPDIVREFRVQGLFIVFTTEILFYLGFALLIPTLPLYLADFQAGTAQIGLVMGVFAVGLLLSRPYIGRFIDQYGARCSLRWGGGILMVSSVLYAFAPALAWVYPIRILHGVSMAFHSTASNAIISSSTTAENRGGIMGLFGISRAVAFGVGPFAGGIFLGWWGHAAVFGLAGALGLAAMTVARFSGDCSMVEAEEAGPRMLDLLKDRTLVFVTGAMFILTIVHGGLTTFLPLHVMRQMAGNLGTFYLVYSLTITVMEILAGKASDRECRVPVMLASVALLGAGLFAVGGVSGTLSLVFASVIYGAGFEGGPAEIAMAQ